MINLTMFSEAPKFTRLFLTALIFATSGCTHAEKSEPALDQMLSDESEVVDYNQLQTEATAAIGRESSLSPAQKSQLIDLKIETATKLSSLQREILKLKGTLMRNILAEKYPADEVVQIEKKIEELSKQKLSVFFGALEKARKALGKTPAREQILQDLRLERETRQFREGRTRNDRKSGI